jgi:hypothetical protein
MQQVEGADLPTNWLDYIGMPGLSLGIPVNVQDVQRHFEANTFILVCGLRPFFLHRPSPLIQRFLLPPACLLLQYDPLHSGYPTDREVTS